MGTKKQKACVFSASYFLSPPFACQITVHLPLENQLSVFVLSSVIALFHFPYGHDCNDLVVIILMRYIYIYSLVATERATVEVSVMYARGRAELTASAVSRRSQLPVQATKPVLTLQCGVSVLSGVSQSLKA